MYQIGTVVFGNWTIANKIGSGSFGAVYELRRQDFGETYRAALKVISVPQDNAEIQSLAAEGMSLADIRQYYYGSVEELVREYAIMSKLKATGHVVSYEDHQVVPHADGIGWDILIRMELLNPLLPYAYRHPFARRDVIRLGIDICKALELCQRYNIIHRDIKPENIFVSDNGDFKLGDFGIARTIEKTMAGLSKKGTFSYMAPEVYAGGEYGFNVDTYSLGIVLYRLLNRNRTPFLPAPPTPITVQNREQALVRRISGERIGAPCFASGRLAEIVLKACAYDPRDRYSSPMQMRQELEAILYAHTDAQLIYPDGDKVIITPNEYAGRSAPQGQPNRQPDHTEGVTTFRPAPAAVTPRWDQPAPARPAPVYRAPAVQQTPAPQVYPEPIPAAPVKKKSKLWIPLVIILAVVVLGGAVGLLLLNGSRQTAKEAEYEQLMEQAQQVRQQDPQEAMELYQQAQELFPEEEAPYISFAYALYLNGNYDACITYIEEDLAMGKQFSVDAQNQLAEIQGAAYFEKAEYAAAASFFRLSVAGGTITVPAMRDYAVSLGRLGDISAADEILQRMIAAGADDDVTAYVEAEIHYAQQEYTAAEAGFRNTLNTTGDAALQRRALRSLAELYRDCAALEKNGASPIPGAAMKEVELLNAGIPAYGLQYDSTLVEMLGMAWFDAYYTTAGAPDAYLENSAENFQKVIDMGIQRDYLYTNLYTIYYELEDYGRAEEALQAYEAAFPSDYVPHALRSVMLITIENEKPENQRNYVPAREAFLKADQLVRSTDDQTYYQQVYNLISQLYDNGWL